MSKYRECEWHNHNHMKIETGWPAFDKQTTCITHGQVSAGTQYSMCLRSRNELKNPMGQPVPRGAMRKFDMESYERISGFMPWQVSQWLNDNADLAVIVYKFSHNSRKKGETEPKEIVHGYIVTDYDGKLLFRHDRRRSEKSKKVMGVCQSYIVALEEVTK